MILEGIKEAIGELRSGFGNETGFITERMNAKAASFDFLRSLKFPAATRVFLLKRAVQSEDFLVVREIASAWYAEWNEERGQMLFSYAGTETQFADQIAQTSFIAFGVPDSQNCMDVYAIEPDRRDVVPPSGNSPWWQVYTAREAAESFEI